MTIIQFQYSAGYHQPATGGVVFMPHRKHAANETVVLPRPFTRPLVDGVVEVDLEPTSDDWVWSVTHDHDTRFYAIPDTDGVIDHAELIPVAPSTLTHRIEPVWWAELRQHQQFIADYVNESHDSVREAIDTVNTVHDTLQTAVTDAERHESVAGAYSRQAQASNEEAWRASKAPDGAADRAKDEADRAEIYRNEANTHRVEAGSHADRAENLVTTVQADYDRIQEFTEGWDSLDDAITEARDEADRATTARGEAVTARNESVTARGEAVAARDETVEARDETLIARDEATDMVENGIRGPQGPMGTLELIGGDNPAITVDTSVGTQIFIGDTMIYGDTGLRRIEPINGPGFGYIRRIGNQVTVYFRDVIAPTDEIYILPTGFRPDVSPQYGFLGRTGGRELATFTVATGGVVTQGTSHNTVLYFTLTFNTLNEWPETLPGISI